MLAWRDWRLLPTVVKKRYRSPFTWQHRHQSLILLLIPQQEAKEAPFMQMITDGINPGYGATSMEVLLCHSLRGYEGIEHVSLSKKQQQ